VDSLTNLFQRQEELTEEYRSADLLFHYTTADVAMNKILLSSKIRLSPRRLANDPLENTAISLGSGGLFMERKGYEEFQHRANRIARRIERKLNQQSRVLSFCTHNSNQAGDGYFGMIKPRMWAQYGDKYKGVCLVFRKKELLSEVLKQFGQGGLFYSQVQDS
jgi:Protein of unknown function (DUF2971)